MIGIGIIGAGSFAANHAKAIGETNGLNGSKVSSVRPNLSTLIHDQKADDAVMEFEK